MRTVTHILGKEIKLKDGHPYTLMTVTVDTGDEEYQYYGDSLQVGDRVECFFDHQWGKLKCRLPGDPKSA